MEEIECNKPVIPDELSRFYTCLLHISKGCATKELKKVIYSDFYKMLYKLGKNIKRNIKGSKKTLTAIKAFSKILPNICNQQLIENYIISLNNIVPQLEDAKDNVRLSKAYLVYLIEEDKVEDLIEFFNNYLVLDDINKKLYNKIAIAIKQFQLGGKGIEYYIPEDIETEKKHDKMKIYFNNIENKLN